MSTELFRTVYRYFVVAQDMDRDELGQFMEGLKSREPKAHERLSALLEESQWADRVFEEPVFTDLLQPDTCQRVLERTKHTLLEHGQETATPLPDKIGPYQVLEKIAEGGMGVVLWARQEQPFRREVALKLVKPGIVSAGDGLQSLERECKALTLMNNDHIAKVYDFDPDAGGIAYLAMEYVHGEPITDYCRRQKLSIRQRVTLFLQVCDGVIHAHQKLIIHGDIKPKNVLVCEQNGRPVVKIIDFGIARSLDPKLKNYLREDSQQRFGSLAYICPEQLEGRSDTRSDIYALGVLLYELITGRPMDDLSGFGALSSDEQRAWILKRPHLGLKAFFLQRGERHFPAAFFENRSTNFRHLMREIGLDLDPILVRALEKKVGRRYQTGSELAADLRGFLEEDPVWVVPRSRLYLARKFVRKRKALAGFILMGTILVTASFAAILNSNIQTKAALGSLETAYAFFDELMARPHPYLDGPDVKLISVLSKAEEKLKTYSEENLELVGRLRMTLGKMYMSLSIYETAVNHFEVAVDLQSRQYGADSLEAARAMALLARAYRSAVRLKLSEISFNQALAIQKKKLKTEHVDLLETYTGLATLYQAQGRKRDAVRLAASTREALIRNTGPKSPQSLDATLTLCSLYQEQGRYAEAIAMLRESLAYEIEISKEDHPRTFKYMQQLAGALLGDGQWREAEEWYRKVILLRNRIYNKNHFYILNAEYGLARVLHAKGELDEALRRLDSVINHRKEQLPENHADILTAKNLKACIIMDGGSLANAVEIFEELIGIYEKKGEIESESALMVMNNLGDCLLKFSREDEALVLLSKALRIKNKKWDEDHSSSLSTRITIGQCYLGLGRFAEAAEQFGKVIFLAEDSGRKNNSLLHLSRAYYGFSLGLMGENRDQEAENLMLKAYQALSVFGSLDYIKKMGGMLWQFYKRRGADAEALLYERYKEDGPNLP